MPDFTIEDQTPGQIICGIDEVGRGPLAGPVLVAGVIVHDRTLPFLKDIRDSKRLSDKKRAMLAPLIQQGCAHHIACIDVSTIDQINILAATMQGMQQCADALDSAHHYLIDGNRIPQTMHQSAQAVVKGDDKSLSIACASIIAKVYRDTLMQQLDVEFPGYGWARNAGYGTAQHLEALSRLGATCHHRASFAPVRRAIQARA